MLNRARKNSFKFAVFAVAMVFMCIFVAVAAIKTESEAAYAVRPIYSIYTQNDFDELINESIADDTLDFSDSIINLYCNVTVPKGFYFKKFAGVFNGNGYKVSGMTVNLIGTLSGTLKNVHFFGYSIKTGSALVSVVVKGALVENVTMSDGEMYIKSNGIVNMNMGTIRKLNVFQDINGNVGFVSANFGTISECILSGDMFVDKFGDEPLIFVASNNGGVVSKCVYKGTLYVKHTSLHPICTSGTFEYCSILMNAVYTGEHDLGEPDDYYVDNTNIKMSYSTLGIPAVFDEEGTWDKSIDGLYDFSDGFDMSIGISGEVTQGFYPIANTILQGSGTEADPFVFSDLTDAAKASVITNFVGGSFFYAVLNENTEVDSNGDVYYVEKRSFSSFEDFKNSIKKIDFSDDGFDENDTIVQIVGESVEGTGTELDPYRICTSEQLVGFINDSTKNQSGKYAVIIKDLAINSVILHNRTLGLSGKVLYANLYGTDKNIYNVDETLFGAIIGKLQNSRIYISARKNVNAVVCERLTGGEIINVKTFGTNNGYTIVSGFAYTNNGSISKSENFVSAEYAFGGTTTETGTVEYCSDQGGCSKINGNSKGNMTVSSGKVIIDDELILTDTADTDAMIELGFDMENDFGYEKGKPIITPSLREEGREYRTRAGESVVIRNFPNVLKNLTYTYEFTEDENGEIYLEGLEAYPIEACEIAVCFDPNAKFRWKFIDVDGSESVPSNLTDVGKYYLKVVLEAGDDYIPYERDICFADKDENGDPIYFFEIKKATLPEGIRFDGIGFSSITDKYTYTGYEISFAEEELVPTNKDKLDAAGFVLRYTYSAEPFNAGEYVQTLTAEADNFTPITRIRSIFVSKAELEVELKPITVDYNCEADYESVETEMSVPGKMPVGTDSGKHFFYILIENGYDIKSVFSSDYSAGKNVGEYTFTCNVKQTPNYNITVYVGQITVVPVPLPVEEIAFNDKTFVYDGNKHSLRADSIPDGYSLRYSGNEQTDAGEYIVEALASCQPNYISVSISAKLTIEKACVTVTAQDVRKKYGYAINNQDFSCSITGFIGLDQFVFGDISIGAKTENLKEGDIPDATDIGYAIVPVLPEEPRNYYFEGVSGKLFIDKIPMTGIVMNDRTENYTGNKYGCEVIIPDIYTADVSYYYENSLDETSTNGMSESGTYTVTATIKPTEETAINYTGIQLRATLRILPLTVEINFNISEKRVTYNGESHAKPEDFPFTVTGANKDEVTIRFETSKGDLTDAVNASTYFVMAGFAGDRNRNSVTKYIPLYVEPKKATVDIERIFEYTSEGIPMVLKEINFDEGGEELEERDITYSYVDTEFGNKLPTGSYITSVGEYAVTPISLNSNYVIDGDPIIVTVTKKSVNLELGTFTIEYGTNGGYVDETSGKSLIVYSGFFTYIVTVPETEKTQELTVAVPGINRNGYWNANVYELTTDMLTEVRNYNITLVGTNRLVVKRRKLNIYWKFNGSLLDGCYGQTTYNGEVIEGIAYDIGNFASGEDLAYITLAMTTRTDGRDTIVRNAGDYVVTLSLRNTVNYELDEANSVLNFKVKQSNVYITIEDTQVRYQESLHNPKIIVEGLLGTDVDKDPTMLAGFRSRIICDYRAGAAPGTTFKIFGEYSYLNYEVGSVSPGTLTVVSGYPTYTLPSLTYVYDGTKKTVTIPSVEDGTRVIYNNNEQITAGEYHVTATVIYPTGREAGLSATLTILPATPVINCPTNYTVYTKNRTFENSELTATATHNGRTVQGSFEIITTDRILKVGENKFSIMFKPSDSVNYTTAGAAISVVAYDISASSLIFDGEYTLSSNGKINISNKFDIRLDSDSYPGINDELKLFLNESEVKMISVKKSEKISVSIRFKGEIVYSADYDIVFVKDEPPAETTPNLEIDYKMLATGGLEFKNGYIILSGNDGRFALDEKYAKEYTLYVNGEEIKNLHNVKLQDKTVVIAIANKKLGISMYNELFTVISAEEWENMGTQQQPQIDEEGGFKTYYWFIIGGGILLAAGAAAFLILFLRGRK